MLEAEGYSVVLSGEWKHAQEHIALKEGRALNLAVRRMALSSKNHGRKHLVFVDNLALALAAGKGRSANHAMKLGAILLARNIVLRIRWIPSERNVSDGPSRGTNTPGYKKRSSTPMTILEVRHLKFPVKEAQEDQMSKSLGAKIVKKKGRCAERRNVVASFTVEDIPPGKRAQQGQLTKLEKKSVSCEQENQYTHYLSKFKGGGHHGPKSTCSWPTSSPPSGGSLWHRGQDGGVQQLAAQGARQAQERQEAGRPLVQRRGRQVQESFRVSGRVAGLARASHLPAAAWRCRRRLAVQEPRVCSGQRSWQVEDGHLSAPIRQSGEDPDSAEQASKVDAGLLPKVGNDNGGLC